MTVPSDLIAELEEAHEGSRELDARIAVAVALDLPQPMGEVRAYLKTPIKYDDCAPGTYWLVERSGMSLRTAPHYTTSLEAALTLVPKEWDWSVYGGPGYQGAQLNRLDGDRPEDEESADASTPELATCAAALRARQAEGHSDDR